MGSTIRPCAVRRAPAPPRGGGSRARGRPKERGPGATRGRGLLDAELTVCCAYACAYAAASTIAFNVGLGRIARAAFTGSGR